MMDLGALEERSELLGALQWLVDDLEDSGEARSETGIHYDSVANAIEWLNKAAYKGITNREVVKDV